MISHKHEANNDDMPVPILCAMVPTIKGCISSLTLWRLYSRREIDYKQIKDFMNQIMFDIGKCYEGNRTGDVTWSDGVEWIGNARNSSLGKHHLCGVLSKRREPNKVIK